MYATITNNYAVSLVLRCFDNIGVKTISREDVTLTTSQYLDHQTFVYSAGEDNLSIRCFYSGRITIKGTLRGYTIDEHLF